MSAGIEKASYRGVELPEAVPRIEKLNNISLGPAAGVGDITQTRPDMIVQPLAFAGPIDLAPVASSCPWS